MCTKYPSNDDNFVVITATADGDEFIFKLFFDAKNVAEWFMGHVEETRIN